MWFFIRARSHNGGSVQGAIPLYVARAQCSFLADETMEVKEDGGEGRKKKKKGEKKTSKKKR